MPGEVVRIEDRVAMQLARELHVSVPTVKAAKAIGVTVPQLLGTVAWLDTLTEEEWETLRRRAEKAR